MKRWPIMPLGEVCFAKSGNSKIIKGSLHTQNDGNLYPAYSATGQDVFSDGFDFDGEGIIISAVGARCGKCFLASGKWRAIANTHVILPKPGKANVKFLWYLLNDESFWVRGGTAQPFVKVLDSLKKLISVPSLAEQERIVKLLDEADALRKLRSQADSRMVDLIPALFHQMFGDLTTNERGWKRVRLSDVSGIIVPTRDKPKRFIGSVPWVTLPDLNGLFIGKSKKQLTHEDAHEVSNRLMPKGTVLLSCAGTLGSVAISTVELYANQQFYGLTPDSAVLDSIFLAGCLLMKGEGFYSRLASTSTIGFFSKQKALGIEIILPPIPLQKEFANRVIEIYGIKSAQSESHARLDDLFQSMLYRAFEGEV